MLPPLSPSILLLLSNEPWAVRGTIIGFLLGFLIVGVLILRDYLYRK
jgi:hypothetical protein